MGQQEAALPSILGTAKPQTQLQSSPVSASGWGLPPGGAICCGAPPSAPSALSPQAPLSHPTGPALGTGDFTELLRAALRLGWTETAGVCGGANQGGWESINTSLCPPERELPHERQIARSRSRCLHALPADLLCFRNALSF